MSNIFAGLKIWEKETMPQCQPLRQDGEEEGEAVSLPAKGSPPVPMDGEMCELYQQIDNLLPDLPNKVIQFFGTSRREGVSTATRKFAETATTVFGRKVLIIDAAHHNPTQHLHFNIIGSGRNDPDAQKTQVEKVCYEAGGRNLYVSPNSALPVLLPQLRERTKALRILGELKKIFDLILIDSSPATTSPDTMAIARCADGVIMVIEADKTKRRVAESVAHKIARNGGNLLGVVLNRRKFHIPDSIYRKF